MKGKFKDSLERVLTKELLRKMTYGCTRKMTNNSGSGKTGSSRNA